MRLMREFVCVCVWYGRIASKFDFTQLYQTDPSRTRVTSDRHDQLDDPSSHCV